MSPELLAQLQTAWVSPVCDVSPVAVAPTVETPEPRKAITGAPQATIPHNAGTVTECGSHLPPFDAIEERDPKRFGFVRSTCRLCGRFLGHRLIDDSAGKNRRD